MLAPTTQQLTSDFDAQFQPSVSDDTPHNFANTLYSADDQFVDELLARLPTVHINGATFLPETEPRPLKDHPPFVFEGFPPDEPWNQIPEEIPPIPDDTPAPPENAVPTGISDVAFSAAVEDALDALADILSEDDILIANVPSPSDIGIGASACTPPVINPVSVDGVSLPMEVDTGAGVSLIPEALYIEHFSAKPLRRAAINLRGVSGPITVVGVIMVSVIASLLGSPAQLPLVVVADSPLMNPLLGRNWLDVINPQWRSSVATPPTPAFSVITDIVQSFQDRFIFDPNNSDPIKDVVAHIELLDNVKPVFHKAYTVPYALLPVLDQKLTQMVDRGILYPVRWSRWASPCVLVKRKDQDYRVAIDPKKTVNPVSKPDFHPIPNPEDFLPPWRVVDVLFS